MGGGTILILLLSIFLKLDQHVAQGINLIFYIPTAITSVIVSLKNKNIMWKEVVIVIIVGVISAGITAQISSKMNVIVLRKLFGAFLIGIAIYEIYSWYKTYIKEKNTHTNYNKNIGSIKK